MKTPSEHRTTDVFQLSNLHVILILLVCGAALIGATWIVSGEFGKVPVSLWDMCTSALADTDSSVAAATTAPGPIKTPQP